MTKNRTIASVELFASAMTLKSPFRIAIGVIEKAENLFVRITSDDGLCGYGEGAPTACITGDTSPMNMAAASDLAPILLGRDPLDIESRLADLKGALHGNPVVLCAFDMALHDLAGKIAGLPLYALLGGGRRDIQTDFTLGVRSPDEMAAEAKEVLGRGYRKIKVKLGPDGNEDVARIKAIRAAVGDGVPLRIDANQGWDEPTARFVLGSLGPYGIEYCESPVPAWNLDALSRLRLGSPVPIMADEALWDSHDAMVLARMAACDYFNIKLDKSGGLREAAKIQAIAEGAGIRCMIGCMLESRLGLTAAAHFASAFPNVAFANLDSFSLLSEDPVVGGAEAVGDLLRLSSEPGLGASLDTSFLERCDRRSFA